MEGKVATLKETILIKYNINHVNLNKTLVGNPFQVIIPFLYLLETSENKSFPDVCRWYRKGTLA